MLKQIEIIFIFLKDTKNITLLSSNRTLLVITSNYKEYIMSSTKLFHKAIFREMLLQWEKHLSKHSAIKHIRSYDKPFII